MSLLSHWFKDAAALARSMSSGELGFGALAQAVTSDGYTVLAMSRVRQFARRWHIPLVNRTLRLLQMSLFGIEIAKDVELGDGVNFMHTLGTVIGGDARIGAGTIFLGGITVGNLDNRGYPTIGENVVIGAGARILGPIVIGAGAQIGANAVVVKDVPAGATAVGIPAVVKTKPTAGRPDSASASAAGNNESLS